MYRLVWLGKPNTDSTWEPESSLPPMLVADYEAGILQEIQHETFVTGGQTLHTLSTNPAKQEQEAKRVKKDSSQNITISSG